MKRILLIMAVALTAVNTAAQKKSKNLLDKIEASGEFAPLFEFQPSHSCPDNITNVRTWNGSNREAAGAQGFIKADGDHFVDENGNTRRFLGTNICFTGCFPSKEDAEKVAEELTRYGINLVRLHYVHHKFPENRIYPEKDSFLEPEQLDRFDYLFAQLKKHGIYTYFQLNIARKFGEQNGFENASKLPYYNNGIDNIDSRMIDLQKKYHKEILCHTNPYTGLEYRNDPAIAMLELVNENSILFAWFGSKYKFDHLTEPYASRIRNEWNNWLSRKYGSTGVIKHAWLDGLKGTGEEYMPDGMMSASASGKWSVQNDKLSSASIRILPADEKDKLKGSHFLRLTVKEKGVQKNIPQLYRKGLVFKESEPLCLRFKMRSAQDAEIRVRVSQNHAPWGVAGLYNTARCTSEWQEFCLNFCSSMDDGDIRLVFSDFPVGTYDIADISLISGTDYKWDENISLEKKNIDWPYLDTWEVLPQKSIDFIEFLSQYESSYFSGLYSNIKENVKPQQAVGGTQIQFGLDLPQASMDYCDAHNYWCHPAFPGRAWDQSNWYLSNKALVNGTGFPGSSLAMMSRSRILGKPFTVSEYDHPNLNFYSAEGDVLISAVGAFQNWSAIMQFAWSHDTKFFRTGLHQTFDMCSATHKLVHFPACYAMFVRGDIHSGDTGTMYTTMSCNEDDIRAIAAGRSVKAPAVVKDPILAASALALVSGRQVKELPELFSADGKTIVREGKDIPQAIRKSIEDKNVKSSSGELTWNWQDSSAGYFMADAPLTKAFTGFVRGRSFRFNGLTLKPGKTRLDWITLTLTNTNPPAKAEEGKLSKGSYLLAVTGMCHNTGAVFVDIGRDRISCAKKNGGSLGVAPVLCEGVPAELTLDALKGKVKCYALGPDGSRTASVKVGADKAGNAIVLLDPKYKTVWYELTIK